MHSSDTIFLGIWCLRFPPYAGYVQRDIAVWKQRIGAWDHSQAHVFCCQWATNQTKNMKTDEKKLQLGPLKPSENAGIGHSKQPGPWRSTAKTWQSMLFMPKIAWMFSCFHFWVVSGCFSYDWLGCSSHLVAICALSGFLCPAAKQRTSPFGPTRSLRERLAFMRQFPRVTNGLKKQGSQPSAYPRMTSRNCSHFEQKIIFLELATFSLRRCWKPPREEKKFVPWG